MYAGSQQEEQRLTREEQKALRGSKTAMELAAEWSEQWGDNSVPAPFEGMEDILRRQMEEKENAPQEGAVAQEQQTQRGRTAEQRAEAERRAFDQERNILQDQTPERQAYLTQKRQEHGAFLDGLKAGDKVYLNGEDTPAFGVVSVSENGMTLEFYDADGEVTNIERVLPEAFTGDNAISLLETAESVNMRGGQGIRESTAAEGKSNKHVGDSSEKNSLLHGMKQLSGKNRRVSEADLPQYMRTGQREHVRNEKQEIVDRGESPFLYTLQEIKDFIRRSVAGSIRNTTKAYGIVGKNLANEVAKVDGKGLDIDGFYMELESNHLDHLSDHIKDSDKRNIPLTEDEIENIPEWIDSFDHVLEVERKGDGSVRIVLGKKINGYSVIVETVSKGRHSIQHRTAWKNKTEVYEKKYGIKKVDESANPTNGPSANSGQGTGSSTYNVADSSEKSNPQNEGRASAEVDTRAALEQEYKERTEAYLAASNRNDTEYDYAGEMARIQELEKRLKETTPPQTAQSAASSPEGALSGDPMAELMEVGEATVENDSGKYTLQVRRKGEGYQARISRDGRLDRVQTFETPQEAAEYALSYVDGQTQARTDAELDNERSEQRERPGPHWPTGREFSEEIIRQKENKAAEAATQTLRERIRRANEELNQKNRTGSKCSLPVLCVL